MITKQDWANMQRDLAAALKRADEAEASAVLWREAAKRAEEYRENNLALLGRLSKAHQANEALRQAPKARVSELEKENARLKRRIDALERTEGKARRDGN